MIHHVTRATKHLIFWSLIIAAISLSAVRLAIKGVESYKADLENRISLLAGTPVKLGGLGAHIRGISPELVLRAISLAPLLATEDPSLQINEIHLGINLGDFLLNREVLSSSWVTVIGAKLGLTRKTDGTIAIDGLKSGKGQPFWLLQGRQYEILHSQISFEDQQINADPITLEDVNLVIMNSGNRHRINMLAQLPLQFGNGLKILLDFEGEIEKPSEVKGVLFVEGTELKLSELMANYFPNDISLTSGTANIKAWGQWQQSKLVSIQSEAQLGQALFSKNGKGTLPINHLDTQFNWQNTEKAWQLDVNRLILETEDANKKSTKKWPDAVFQLAGDKTTEKGQQKLKMYAQQLDLGEASKLLQFFAPLTEEQSQSIGQYKLTGLLKDFSLFAEPELKSFALAGRFDSITVEASQGIPGLTNISGVIKGSDNAGIAEIDSQGVRVNVPSLFAKSLLLNNIKGQIAWHQTDVQWNFSSPSFALDSPAFNSESRFRVDIPKSEEKPYIDLQMAISSDDLSQLATYLPTQVMAESLKNWLSNAFLAGKAHNGGLLLVGKADKFPYTDGSGVFEAKFKLDKVKLHYNPDWPPISNIKGDLLFNQNNIEGLFNQGIIGKINIDKALLKIPDLGNHKEHLLITGEAKAEIIDALNVLQQSPLADKVATLMKETTIKGASNVVMDLTIPLWPGTLSVINGTALLKDSLLTVNRLGLEVSKINGELKFSRDGVYSKAIKAFALGNPISINIEQADQETQINVDGLVSVSSINKVFGWADSKLAEGEAEYDLQLRLPKPNLERPSVVDIKSTLAGVALQLPGGITKTKAQEKPSALSISLTDETALPLSITYNNEIKAAITLNSREKSISSGHILIGIGEAQQTKTPGIKLEVNRERLPLQDLLGQVGTQQASNPGININEISIHSPSALWDKSPIGAFDLALKRSPNNWSGNINSTFAKGTLQIPHDTQGMNPVVLEMGMINLSALKQLKTDGTATNNDFKPLINIHSKRTLWQSENLGELTLTTQRTPKGMNIKRLELLGDDAKLLSSGNWREAGFQSTTHLNGKLEMRKAQKLFEKLNITKDLTSTTGSIDFKLAWNAAPWQVTVPALQGEMDVKLNEGRILSVEPGFGRVLGILAVAQWIKRLQLDFSDIYGEGLTYNNISGHFTLFNGKASTTGLVIDAVPAKITIIGDTDLVGKTVDQVIKVVPKSLDAVPIAGTIMSKVAAVVGKTLTGEDQEGFFFGTQYKVKGSWDDIKISSSHENDGLFQKTWNSITDFPWNEDKKQQ